MTSRDGLLLTTVERTVIDVASTRSTFSAVAAIDAALHADRWGRHPALTTRGDLIDTWERMLPFRGAARTRQLLEFADGKLKYPDERILAGRTPREVLYAEKQREDALRRCARGFARWDYAVGMSMPALGARLAAVGVLPARTVRFREQPSRAS